MLKLFDVRCPEGHVTEDWLEGLDEITTCSLCGLEAHAIISPVRFTLEGTTGHFPTAADKWARMHNAAAPKPGSEEE